METLILLTEELGFNREILEKGDKTIVELYSDEGELLIAFGAIGNGRHFRLVEKILKFNANNNVF